MEDRKNIPLKTINRYRNQSNSCFQVYSEHRGIFFRAYAHGNRLEGECALSVVWRLGKEKKCLIHRYNLVFGQVGIDEYMVEEIPFYPGKVLEKHIFPDSVQISLPEAAALLQDAYEINKMFKSFLPRGFRKDDFLLACNTAQIDRTLLCKKLSCGSIDKIGFVNAYAAAMRREDVLLLYDLSSPARQCKIGTRKAELLTKNLKLDKAAVYLKSAVWCADQSGEDTYKLETYQSTREDLIQRVLLSLKIIGGEGEFLIDSVTEIQRNSIDEEDPRNPLNYEVLCSLYQISDKKVLLKWLATHQHLFLSGEFAYGATYKWIMDVNSTYTSFNISDCILCEIIITDTQVVIFSHKQENLLMLEKEVIPLLKGQIKEMRKFSLSIASLYRIMTG